MKSFFILCCSFCFAVLPLQISFAQSDALPEQLAAVADESAQAEYKPFSSEFYQDFITAAWYEKHGDQELAFEYYEKLNKVLPQNRIILKGLVNAAFSAGNKEAVGAYAPLFFETAPDDADATALYAAYLWGKGDLKGAAAQYERAIKLSSGNQDVIIGYINFLAGVDTEKAVSYLKILSRQYPASAGFTALQIAELYLKANDETAAVGYLKEISKQQPYLAEPYLGLAKIYEKRGDSAAALEQYLAMEKASLAGADIFNKIGAHYVLTKQKDLSASYFLKAKALDNANPLAAQFLTLAAQDNGDFAAALKYLTDSRDYSKTPSDHLRAAYFYTRLGDAQKAAEVLQEAYAKFNRDAQTGLYYALALIDLKNYKEAEVILLQVLEKSPDNETALLHYSLVLEQLKKYKEMEKALKKLIANFPQNAQALNFLGYYLVDRTKRLEEGGEYIKKAVALNPDDIAFIDSLAWYYYKKGDKAKALSLLESIAPSAGDDWEVLLHTAVAYEAAGAYEAARKYYRASLEIEPQNKAAQKGLKRVIKLLK
jgi:tetratricopeptide (TPR) repeat protein